MNCRYFPIFILFFTFSCKKNSIDTFYIKNTSNKSITYTTSNLFPDTSIVQILNYKIINPGQLDGPFAYSTSASGVVEVFLFDNNIFQTNTWDNVSKKYLILKRYDLTKDSISKMGGVITYQ